MQLTDSESFENNSEVNWQPDTLKLSNLVMDMTHRHTESWTANKRPAWIIRVQDKFRKQEMQERNYHNYHSYYN